MGSANDALTWRDVTAPDFGTAIQGIKTAAQLFGQAGQTAIDTTDGFQSAQSRIASDAIAAKAAQFTDPTALAAAQKLDPTLGVDPNIAQHLHAADYAATQARVNTLLANASTQANTDTTKFDLNKDQYVQARQVDRNARTDAAKSQIAQYQQLAANDAGAAADYWKANAGVFGSLDPDQQESLIKGTFDFAKDRSSLLNDASSRASQALNRSISSASENRTSTEFNQNQAAYKAGVAGNSIGLDILAGATDPETARDSIYNDPRYKNADDLTKKAIADTVNGRFNLYDYGSPTAPNGTPAAGAPGGAGGSLNIPFGETASYVSNILGNASKAGVDLSSGSNAQKAQALLPFLTKQESGGNTTAVSPKGARGIVQIMPKTAANPGFGMQPIDLNNSTPQQQSAWGAQYLTKLLDKYGGDPTKALAAYNGGTGNVDNWISSQGGRANVTIAQNLINQKTSQDAINPLSEAIPDALNDHRLLPDVVASARQGAFAQVPAPVIQRMITNLQDQAQKIGSPINAATALAILQNNKTRTQKRSGLNTPLTDLIPSALAGESFKWFPNSLSGHSVDLGGGYSINDEGVQGDLAKVASGSWAKDSAVSGADAQTQTALAGAQQQVEQLQQRIASLTAAAGANPYIKARIPLYQAQLDAAIKARDSLNGIVTNPANRALPRINTILASAAR